MHSKHWQLPFWFDNKMPARERRLKPSHDDVIKWKHFPRYWPFVRGIQRSPVNSPHKGQWRGALMFPLICVWINDWVNNREAGCLRRHRGNCDVTVMGNWKQRKKKASHNWPLWRESTDDRWFPSQRASNEDFSCQDIVMIWFPQIVWISKN